MTLAALLVAGWAYAHGVHRLHTRGDRWSAARSASFGGGLLVIAAALVSPLAGHDDRFAVHATQHLLLGMLAPLLLALAAPVTLALRTLPAAGRARLLAILHSPVVRLAGAPATAALLAVGGLYGLYLTPLYAATLRHPPLHLLAHIHFLLAGCLLAWSLVGLDPVARRASFQHRSVVLLIALAAHAIVAKLLYATDPAGIRLALADRQLGAQLLWYGGDLVELALLIVFFGQWYAAAGRRLARERRRACGGGHSGGNAAIAMSVAAVPKRETKQRLDT
jgi:putative membrane protein